MNIGMILDNEFTGDMRVENEVQALSAAGHNVFVLCFNYGSKKNEEDYFGAKIIRISQSKSKAKKLRALTNTIFNYYPRFWANHIVKFVKNNDIDVLHVHDLYMFGSAFIAEKKLYRNIKIVGDLHENYVEGLKHYRFSTTFPGNLLISIPKWEKTEVKWIKKLDFGITVIEEALERYKQIGIDENKLTVVSNYINIEEFTKHEADPAIVNKYKDHFVLSYIGGFDIHRGIESVVRSLPLLKDRIDNLKLVLVGTGQNVEIIKQIAADLNVMDRIVFEGWQPPSSLPSYIEASSICLIPHLKTLHTDNTIPHKLFQYMFYECPVISSDCNPLKRILNETGAGLTYESNNHSDLADKILTIYNDADLQSEMGKKGKEAVLKEYNWENTSKNLIALYENIKKIMSS